MSEEEIKRRTFPGGSVVCVPKVYAGRDDLPDTPTAKSIVVALHECQQAAAVPEQHVTEVPLTGRYEGSSSFVCINQAGYHAQLWWSVKLDGPADRRTRRVLQLRADHNPELGDFDIYENSTRILQSPDEKRPAPLGHLRMLDRQRIEITWDPGQVPDRPDDVLTRMDSRATLSVRATNALRRVLETSEVKKVAGEVDAVLQWEHLPLSQAALDALFAFLKSDEMHRELQILFTIEPRHGIDVDTEKKARIIDQIRAIERLVQANTIKALAPDDRLAFRAATRTFLMNTDATFSTGDGATTRTDSLYGRFQRVRVYNEQFTTLAPNPAVPVPAIEQWLGVRRGSEFRYEIEVDLDKGIQTSVAIPYTEKIEEWLDDVLGKLPEEVRKEVKEKIMNLIQSSAGVISTRGDLVIRRFRERKLLFQQN